ncbi:ATP-grasp domain-containing protein [Micromonospora sp. BQ11]|uniref:ATP-grasp domain-containing protein n=1 Tax=Micromonospora sp. BQ11 TaxID=3452212 RepID=UPI003F8B0C69
MSATGVSRPHVVVLHRWRDAYAHYDRYLDHDAFAVSYVTTEVGAAGVPAQAAAVAVVDATDDVERVGARIDELAARFGEPAAVVALKEDDLVPAAVLAARRGCFGRTVRELTPFRDKLVMARTVSAAGIPVPATAPAPDPAAVREHAARHGWPVVVKPRTGSSSAGVRLIAGPDEAADLGRDAMRLVQAYEPDPIHHVDGVFDGATLGPWRLSAYLDTCLAFRDGRALGSVEQDDPTLIAAVGVFTTSVLRALTDRPTVFHLELFLGRAEDGSPRCTFLECGARVGGAEIPFVWRDVHGYDLMEAAFRIALGREPQDPPPAAHRTEVGGWLLVPAPAGRPCRIEEATSMIDRNPGPYAEVVPRVGDVLPAADAYYEHVGARYRFRGTDSTAVRAAVLATARDARVTGRTVTDLVTGSPR